MNDKQKISLQLDAHTISLQVDREKESHYRNAGEMLNRLYQYYRKLRPSSTAEQLWMYVALHVGVNLQNDAREKDIKPLEEKIQQLNQEVEKKLNEQI